MRLGRLGRAVAMGMMFGGVVFLAACPGDLEEAAQEATKVDEVAEPQGTRDECLEQCQQAATRQEEDCIAKLSEEEKADPTAFDSPVLACQNDARGDLTACQVECNNQFRGR